MPYKVSKSAEAKVRASERKIKLQYYKGDSDSNESTASELSSGSVYHPSEDIEEEEEEVESSGELSSTTSDSKAATPTKFESGTVDYHSNSNISDNDSDTSSSGSSDGEEKEEQEVQQSVSEVKTILSQVDLEAAESEVLDQFETDLHEVFTNLEKPRISKKRKQQRRQQQRGKSYTQTPIEKYLQPVAVSKKKKVIMTALF